MNLLAKKKSKEILSSEVNLAEMYDATKKKKKEELPVTTLDQLTETSCALLNMYKNTGQDGTDDELTH